MTKEKEKVKALWKLCFDDSDAFIKMYFRLRYNKEVNVSIDSGAEVISALQMIPYPMTFCEREVPTAYISGACTHPEYQGNGVMRELLSQAFTRMQQNSVLFSTLIPAEPWLFEYYTRMGYAPVFNYSEHTFLASDIQQPVETEADIEQTTEFQEDAYLYLNVKVAQRPCCLQHTAADFKVVLADLAITNGWVYVARQADQVAGIAVVYKRGDTACINELFAESDSIKDQLLYHIRQASGNEKIVQLLPPTNDLPVRTLGMARIINAPGVLRLYASAHPEVEMNIALADKQLSSNNGYYYIYKGKCRISKKKFTGACQRLTIGELSEKIFAPLQPYMSLMMN